MADMENPLLGSRELPPFPEIRPEHVEPAMREVLQAGRRQLESIAAAAAPSFDSVVEPLEALQHRLSKTWSPVSHLNAVANNESLRQAYNACLPLLSEYQTDLAQSEALYRAYLVIAERDGARLSAEQRRVLDNALRDFRLAGVALDATRKQRFKEVMSELSQLGAKFEQNVLDCTNAWTRHVTDPAELEGVNESILAQARQRAQDAGRDGWLLALNQPTYVAVMTDAVSRELRRAFYEAWSTRASDVGPFAGLQDGKLDNGPVMEDILRLRHEAARLLEFPSYADYALATRMARHPQEVLDFLRQLARAARPAAQREFAELEQFAGQKLEAWDVAFHAERLQRQRHSISQEALRPYFPLPRVLDGLFDVAQRLFGVTIREVPGVPTWHADVRYFEIVSAEGRATGSFYLDPYAREQKRSGAWMDECVGRMSLPAGSTLPVAYLVCNFLPPAGAGQPALLTHDDVVTMFHEFGHGLHHMLTRVPYPSIAGINGVSWDAVELPSQFMENYAWHPEVLTKLSAHVQTGEPLPAAMQAQLVATRNFHAGLATVRQLEFALFDFRIHAEYDPARGGRIAQILAEVRDEVSVITPPAWNRFPHSFGHIFAGGYAAGYYSYKWAEVLAADAFGAFEESGVFDRGTARRFLDSILSRGGSRDALDAFVEFRGRKPDIQPLLKQHGIAS
jgi:oligopeptidase A